MERQEKAFRELKERFTKELVLATPDLDRKIRMEVNTSDYVTGGVLLMKGGDDFTLKHVLGMRMEKMGRLSRKGQ